MHSPSGSDHQLEEGAPLTLPQIRRLSPTALAYLGDAVYELHVRQHHLFPPQRIERYHRQVVQRVRGEAQAQILALLWSHLTSEEQALVRWGRNGARRSPRQLALETYRQATGFEALVGYLHLTQPQRLQEVLALTDTLTALSPSDPPQTDPESLSLS